jgi:hypothetical protein
MSPKFLTIAYFTKGNSYETLSENLKESCKTYDIPLILKPIENLGSWESNTHYKATFILECLNTYPQNLVYVDVDAVFRRYPDLFDTLDCDIAYRTESFKWRKNEALSGTIFIKNSDKGKEIIQKWIETNDKIAANQFDPTTWEQANMQRVINGDTSINYFNLPPEYTFITDHTRKLYPGLKPVVEHFQESREVLKGNRKK